MENRIPKYPIRKARSKFSVAQKVAYSLSSVVDNPDTFNRRALIKKIVDAYNALKNGF